MIKDVKKRPAKRIDIKEEENLEPINLEQLF